MRFVGWCHTSEIVRVSCVGTRTLLEHLEHLECAVCSRVLTGILRGTLLHAKVIKALSVRL